MFMDSITVDVGNENAVIHPYFKYLKVKAHRYGGLHIYLDIDKNVRTVLDIVKLAYKFYESKVDYLYLITLPYDEIKKKAAAIHKQKGYVLWKDITGVCKFKDLTPDCVRQNALELTLDYDISQLLDN
jgi:hypothetical protein